jgi:hypothetical protein
MEIDLAVPTLAVDLRRSKISPEHAAGFVKPGRTRAPKSSVWVLARYPRLYHSDQIGMQYESVRFPSFGNCAMNRDGRRFAAKAEARRF